MHNKNKARLVLMHSRRYCKRAVRWLHSGNKLDFILFRVRMKKNRKVCHDRITGRDLATSLLVGKVSKCNRMRVER